jgi:hypothetical protein
VRFSPDGSVAYILRIGGDDAVEGDGRFAEIEQQDAALRAVAAGGRECEHHGREKQLGQGQLKSVA